MHTRNDTGVVYPKQTFCRWRYVAIGILSFAVLGLASQLDAKKPEKPEPPPAELDGLLYYKTFDFAVTPYTVWEYDAATGISRELFEIGGSASHVEPSEFDHNGRWFAATGLVTLDEYPPLPGTTIARGIYGIFVVREDTYNYVLIDDITFEVCNNNGGYDTPPVLWMQGDSKIMVMARYLDPDTWNVVPGSVGLYEINIDWSSGEPLAAGDPEMVPGSEWMPVVYSDYYGPRLNVASYDVSADGNQVFYSTYQPVTALYSLDLTSGLTQLIATDLWRARYCDITREIVAEGTKWGVYKVSADYNSITTLVDPGVLIGGPVWSPAGTEVAYEFYHNPKPAPKRFADVRVISSEDGTELADPSDVNGDDIQVYGWVQ